jgi:hypothetical protein
MQSEDKTGTTDLKAAKEEKVKTFLQVSLFSFLQDEIKPRKRCCQGLAAELPLRLVFFSPLSSQ